MDLMAKINQGYGTSGFYIPVNKQTIKLIEKKEKFVQDIKKIQILLNKTNTFDFFVGINHKQQFDVEQITKYKVEKVLREGVYINLRLIMSMRCVKHILFVKVALKRIELAKEIFTLDI